MSTILDKIIAHKKKELPARKKKTPLAALQKKEWFERKTFSLSKFIRDDSRTGIIAEYKRKSPSKGVINNKALVEEVSFAYAAYASGISILTDEEYFGGSLEDLAAARFNEVPLLRKDFIIDEYQVIEARAYGADVILLIAACLSTTETARLASLAKELEMEVLLEIYDETELDHISADVDLVGVNNRDLKTFEVNAARSFELLNYIPSSKLAVAESGISDVETIVSLKQAGFKGFLIGENFMKHADPGKAFTDFAHRLKMTSISLRRKHED